MDREHHHFLRFLYTIISSFSYLSVSTVSRPCSPNSRPSPTRCFKSSSGRQELIQKSNIYAFLTAAGGDRLIRCAEMFIWRPSTWKRRKGAVPVYLNVYDVTPLNGYAYWFGLGVYHSGVQVHGVEYAYGSHDYQTTGIFDAEPRLCPGFVFRKSILIGWTDLGPQEVQDLIDELSENYAGNTYNLISKNCNHFCNDACHRLTGNAIPRWVNRLANLGFLCKCVLPVQVAAVRRRANEKTGGHDGERRRLRSAGSRRFGVERNDGVKCTSVISGRRSGSRKAGVKCRPAPSMTDN